MDGWWDSAGLDEFFAKVIRAQIQKGIKKNTSLIYQVLLARLLNRQSKIGLFRSGKNDYDLGNDLFVNMLDSAWSTAARTGKTRRIWI